MMKILIIAGIIIVGIYCVIIYCIMASVIYSDYKMDSKYNIKQQNIFADIIKFIFAPLMVSCMPIIFLAMKAFEYIRELKKHGGYKGYQEWKKQQAIEEERERARREAERKAEKEEWERIKTAFLNGEISRTELPRIEDGKESFEFKPEMGLSVDYESDVREIIYVESSYNERLNRFFKEHKSLRLYHMYKFVYLPTLSEQLSEGILDYLYPDKNQDGDFKLSLASDYPMQYLVYPDDNEKIKQGMFFFRGGRDNHGAEYIEGDYHPLYEGSDEEIIAQLDAIVKKVHSKHSRARLYYTTKMPKTEGEGVSENYADEKFWEEVYDDEVAIIIKEVREKVNLLREKGLTENLLRKIFQESPKLSRLVITRDYRITLPDYKNKEIKMEPINKAVYLLFLKHPEGIIFKHLPDYRKELAEIYQKIKPLGLNERAIQSIEDVTNPCLNSINEKCARIRSAFISQFDESIAKNYFVTGNRGEAKKISLPRDLVVWE